MRKITSSEYPNIHRALRILSDDNIPFFNSEGEYDFQVEGLDEWKDLYLEEVDRALGKLSEADLEIFVMGEPDEIFVLLGQNDDLGPAYDLLEIVFNEGWIRV